MTPESQTLLDQIATVAEDDAAGLDEMDARFFAFIKNIMFSMQLVDKRIKYSEHREYHKDLQALWDEIPEGWSIDLYKSRIDERTRITIGCHKAGKLNIGILPTPHRALMHAIVQAKEYKREHERKALHVSELSSQDFQAILDAEVPPDKAPD